MWFKILWSINAVATFGVVYFFIASIGYGTFSMHNILLWLAIFATLFAIMAGSLWLKKRKQSVAAILLLLVLAIPVFLYLLFTFSALFSN